MVPDGDAWTGVIGMATDFPLGDYSVEVTADGVSMGAVPVSVTERRLPAADADGAR